MEKEYMYKTFEQFLNNMLFSTQNQHEFIFPAQMIEDYCREKNYPCYHFAHNLEGDLYMRAMINRFTLEFLARYSPKNQTKKEALILQIKHSGQLLYYKPNVPEETIYVI